MDFTHDYDALMYAGCPNYVAAQGIIAGLIPDEADSILSLGSGTGNIEARILLEHPRKTVCGIEKEFIYWQKSQIKMAGYKVSSRFDAIHGDIVDSAYPKSDCIISGLTLHHIADEQKKEVFKKTHEALPQGGTFINYDIVKGVNDEEQKKFVKYVTNHMRKNGLEEDFITEEKDILNGIGKNADIPMSWQIQSELLKEIGFKVKLHWRDKLFFIYSATK